jgi:hypothetical protein
MVAPVSEQRVVVIVQVTGSIKGMDVVKGPFF